MNDDDLELGWLEIRALDTIAAVNWAHVSDIQPDALAWLDARGFVTVKTWAGRVALSPEGRDLYTQMGVGT